MTTISFTAGRDGFSPPVEFLGSLLDSQVPFAERYVTGACRGGDAWTGAWLHLHRPNAQHWVIVPADRSQVDPWWSRPEHAGRAPLIQVQEMPPGTTYADRNAELVRQANWVIGFPAWPEDDPRSARSGTWQTIRMARRAGKLSMWHCAMPPHSGRIAAMPEPAAYCEVHDQPLEWCEAGYVSAGDGSRLPCPGTTTLSQAFRYRDYDSPLLLPQGREHQPRRGDEVEAWLEGWRDNCAYQLDAGARNRLTDMLEDYRRHADDGSALGKPWGKE